ncbi:MAG: hypothetical protein K6U80_06790 [Firmicutes bacterium]|nr:hypothetical protein [Bacillota bacterium]
MGKDIRQAFAADRYDVVSQHSINGRTGYCAEHQTAKNAVTGKKKRAYYVEGSPYEMGYLMGYMAPEEIELMSTIFIENIIFEFFKDNNAEFFLIKWFKHLVKKYIQLKLKSWVYEFSQDVFKDIPYEYKQEIYGIYRGYLAFCEKNQRKPIVTFRDLWVLNVGIDCLLSFFYNPNNFLEKFPKFPPEKPAALFRVPIACNGFSVFGNATRDPAPGGAGEAHYHYFGRDFMFPTADVFQNVACLIIYNPIPDNGRIPLVSMTAPGFAGSMTAMNTAGVAMGVDIAPSGNCDHRRDGFNSLLLVRDSIHRGSGAREALDNVVNAQRGVSWNYIIADGKNNQAVVVEAGLRTSKPESYPAPPEQLLNWGLLPDPQFFKTYENQTHQEGLMARWHDYKYPEAFLQFNRALFEYFGKMYDDSLFSERGYISKRINGKVESNCPFAFYFAPQREDKDDVLIVTNHFITPTMRYCAMDKWTVEVVKGQLDDIQWRYDKLNDLILEHYGNIDWAQAWRIINFLAAEDGSYVPDYYDYTRDYEYRDEDGQTHKTKAVQGSISLCNLTTKVIQTRYGYFVDEPVTITLGNYV